MAKVNGIDLVFKKIPETTHKALIDGDEVIPFAGPDGTFYYISRDELFSQMGGFTSGFQGDLAISDTPVADGMYMPTESGTYTNAGGIVVDMEEGITFIVKSGSEYESIIYPIAPPTGDVEVDDQNPVIGGKVYNTVGDNILSLGDRLDSNTAVGSGTAGGWVTVGNLTLSKVSDAGGDYINLHPTTTAGTKYLNIDSVLSNIEYDYAYIEFEAKSSGNSFIYVLAGGAPSEGYGVGVALNTEFRKHSIRALIVKSPSNPDNLNKARFYIPAGIINDVMIRNVSLRSDVKGVARDAVSVSYRNKDRIDEIIGDNILPTDSRMDASTPVTAGAAGVFAAYRGALISKNADALSITFSDQIYSGISALGVLTPIPVNGTFVLEFEARKVLGGDTTIAIFPDILINSSNESLYNISVNNSAFEKKSVTLARGGAYEEERMYISALSTSMNGNEVEIRNLKVYVPGILDKTSATRDIIVPLEWGAIHSQGYIYDAYYGKSYLRTPKMIAAPLDGKVYISTSQPCDYRVSMYDSEFKFIRQIDFTSSSNSAIEVDGVYFKLTFRKNSSIDPMDRITVKLTGAFPDEYLLYNPSPTDGVQPLTVHVNVADATASDARTNNVQDAENLLPDYGLLLLPESYSPTGPATRLIIYCHGAGVNYDPGTTSFPATDIRPEYWLSEGYAVMDIEGNPFNNIDEHFYIPQAIQCYISAYEWATRAYNLRKDGVFLGGRSMGGGMVFEILQSRIPVIAACPLVPVANTLLAWNYCNAVRREFLADHLGFTGAAPTWTNSNPMTEPEWDYIQDNWDKMVKYSPLWRGIVDLPGKDVLFTGTRISSSTQTSTIEADIFENLHFRAKAPVKIFSVEDDATMPWQRNAELIYKMLLNAGQICELRMFEEGGHHFEIDNPDCITDYTNSRGELIEGVPVVYIEMLQFWKRYEQVN